MGEEGKNQYGLEHFENETQTEDFPKKKMRITMRRDEDEESRELSTEN